MNSYRPRHNGFRRHTSNRPNRFRRNFSRGRRFDKSFNPSDLVRNNAQEAGQQTAYTPVHSFNEFNISETLKKNISLKNYTSPTPIQDQVIPVILEGKDVIGIANTGTGKTAAFLIPLIEIVSKNRNKKVLIVVPTRELAVQIKNEFIDFAKGSNIYCAVCIGGASMFLQKKDLRRNPNFIIGTPGRIKDLIQQKSIDLSVFEIVVLDEADHMVDIGFIQDIQYFISLLPKVRQSLFFSATIEGKVREVLNSFVQNAVTVSVKQTDITQNVQHDVVKITNRAAKIDKLHELLNQQQFEKVLIFAKTKRGVQKLSDELVRRGFSADVIHGDKRQRQRLQILEKFKRNEIAILLATDVASRGLDIDNVSHVINYDMPATYKDYVHRIGRTGRANKKGIALTFVE